MSKLLIILLIIGGGAFLAYKYVQRKFFRFFDKVSQNSVKENEKKESEEVLFKKDNLVVLKGEAGKKKEKE